MKKRLILLINIAIILIIMAIVIGYSYFSSKAKKAKTLRDFEDVTMNIIQPTKNYLYGVQQIVNSWGHYINSQSMTMEQSLEFLNKAKPRNYDIDIQVLYLDEFENYGYAIGSDLKSSSQNSSTTNVNKLKIRYYWDTLFLDCDDNSLTINDDEKIHMTRMFTNQVNGKQSVAFYHPILLKNEETGDFQNAVVMYVISVTSFDYNLKITNSNFHTVNFVIVTQNGDYISRNAHFKNTNVFEFLNSYNNYSSSQLEEIQKSIQNGNGIFIAKNSTGENVYIAYASDLDENGFIIVSMLSNDEILQKSQNFSLPLTIGFGLFALLFFNIIIVLIINKKLNNAVQQADNANQAKSDFLSSVSHDIRTPLNAIIGFTSIAQQQLENKEQLKDKLTKISLAGQHLLMLINDVLDISQIENQGIILEPKPTSIKDILTTLQSVTESIAKNKNINLELVMKNIEYPYIEADKLRLNQIYVNLVGNALKYTENDGYVKFTLEEISSTQKDKICLKATISDTGIGMSKDFLPHMFEAFIRQEDNRTSKIAGTGLGLAITKHLVDLMDGTINCESELDKGTTFTVEITFPISKEQIDIEEKKIISNEDDLYVLVAEDNDINWEIDESMLDMNGIKSERAENGEIAIQMLKQNPDKYSLILMDIRMPVMDGLEATKKIRSDNDVKINSIPIIALTADAFSENVNECIQCGMNAHIAKPIQMDTLMNAINKYKSK